MRTLDFNTLELYYDNPENGLETGIWDLSSAGEPLYGGFKIIDGLPQYLEITVEEGSLTPAQMLELEDEIIELIRERRDDN